MSFGNRSDAFGASYERERAGSDDSFGLFTSRNDSKLGAAAHTSDSFTFACGDRLVLLSASQAS
jgi:hypothetical protein